MPLKGQAVATKRRRNAFIEHLKSLGPGELCVYWPWTTVTDGYVFVRYDGKTTTAHRWVYEQINGSLPAHLEACHTCDNPPCVRPSHVWPGTHGENLADAYRKGRKKATRHAPPGEAHPMAKLKTEQVENIRALHESGVSQGVIGRSFGISRSQVANIIHGRSWKEQPKA